MDVVFRLVRCRVADGMPLLVQERICHRPQNGAPTCHSHPVSRKLPFSPESWPQNGSPPCQRHSVSMALSESGNLRGTLDCRVETQGTEPQDSELFGEEEVSDAFEKGGGDHLMRAFLSRWRQGFPRPETDGTLIIPLRSGREKTLDPHGQPFSPNLRLRRTKAVQ